MNLGVLVGAVLVVVGFFLGWVGLDVGPASFSMSGYQIARLAKEHGAVYYAMFLLPVGAVLAGLVALADKQAAAKLGMLVGGAFTSWAAFELFRLLWRTTLLGLWLCLFGCIVLFVAGAATKKNAWS